MVVTNGGKVSVDVFVRRDHGQPQALPLPFRRILFPSRPPRSVSTPTKSTRTGGYSFGSGKALCNNRGGLTVLKDANEKMIGEFLSISLNRSINPCNRIADYSSSCPSAAPSDLDCNEY